MKQETKKEAIGQAGVVPERLQDKIGGPVQKLELPRIVKGKLQDKLGQ